MDDIIGYISRQSLEFEQPGDTSCPQQEQMDAMKLEVQLRTVMVLGAVLYLTVALLLKRKQLARMGRDAMISLVRAGMPGAGYFVTAPSPDEGAATAAAADILRSQVARGARLASELWGEPGRGVIEIKHSTDVVFRPSESARLHEHSP